MAAAATVTALTTATATAIASSTATTTSSTTSKTIGATTAAISTTKAPHSSRRVWSVVVAVNRCRCYCSCDADNGDYMAISKWASSINNDAHNF
jgi:hypothetical protein